MRTQDPVFYEQIIRVFPEMQAHERYYRDLDHRGDLAEYSQDFEGVRRWIDEHMGDDPAVYGLAVTCLETINHLRKSAGPEVYPPRYVLNCFMNGSFKRGIRRKFVEPKRRKKVS